MRECFFPTLNNLFSCEGIFKSRVLLASLHFLAHFVPWRMMYWLYPVGEFGGKNCIIISLSVLFIGKWAACKDHVFLFPHSCCLYIPWLPCRWEDLVRTSAQGLCGEVSIFLVSILSSLLAHTFKPHSLLFLSHRSLISLDLFTLILGTNNRCLVSHIS